MHLSTVTGLLICATAAILAPHCADAEDYQKRFMEVCAQVAHRMSPGAASEKVCACTERRAFAVIAANPAIAPVILEAMQKHKRFALPDVASLTPEEQKAAISVASSLGAAYIGCLLQ
jgi:hypothetical protein